MKSFIAACAFAALPIALLVAPAAAGDFDATVHVVKDASPQAQASVVNSGTALGSRLIYTYKSPGLGIELWISDGTKAGTHLLKDIWSGPTSSEPADLTVFKGKVYFRATDTAHGNELWVTDGTSAGTKLFKDVYPGSQGSYAGDHQLVPIGGTLYFGAYGAAGPNAGAQVWKTDGVATHSSVVQAIRKSDSGGATYLAQMTRWGNRLVFRALDDLGAEPWATDGSTTQMIKDINPGAGDSDPSDFTVLGTNLYFTATDDGSDAHIQIWRAAPPSPVLAAFPVSPTVPITEPDNLVANGSTLYFTATSGAIGNELWRSDGNGVGTVLAKDINQIPGAGSDIGTLKATGGSVYFEANDGNNNFELWAATTIGVHKMKELNPSPTDGSYPGNFVAIGSQVFFTATDGALGYELYTTDGTVAGTKLVRDIVTGPGSSSPRPLAAIGSTLFLSAQTPALGEEIWAYTTKASTTKGYPKAKYTKKAAKKKQIRVTVRVRATGTTPTGKVYLKQGTKVVGVGVLKNGNASIRITKKWGKGTHNVRAYYAGSVYARISSSTLIHVKVK